jgi:hypothetical protein
MGWGAAAAAAAAGGVALFVEPDGVGVLLELPPILHDGDIKIG